MPHFGLHDICDPSDRNESHVGKMTFVGKQQNVIKSHFLLISRY